MNRNDAKKVYSELRSTGASGVAVGVTLTNLIACVNNLDLDAPDKNGAIWLVISVVALAASMVAASLQMRRNVELTERKRNHRLRKGLSNGR